MRKIFQFIAIFGLFWCFLPNEAIEEENPEDPDEPAEPAEPAGPVTINIGEWSYGGIIQIVCVKITWSKQSANANSEKKKLRTSKSDRILRSFFVEEQDSARKTAKHV